MKKRETVSSWQMTALFLTFLTGSAIVNIPAPLTGAAENAAWVSLWIANLLGMLLLACVLYLQRKYPEMTLVQYSHYAVGKVLTLILAVPFFLVTLIILANIVSDIGGFFKSTMMRETPSYVFHSVIFFTAALTVKAGIEVMARMFTLLLCVVYVVSIMVLLLAIPTYHVELLLPLFPNGFTPVWHGAYHAWGFPYSEIILFSMVLPYVRDDKEPLGKMMYGAVFVNGIILSLVIVCSIMSLGPMAANLKFSLFVLARMVEVREIIERIESVIGMTLIAGSYMKATIVLFILNLGLSQLFRVKDDRALIFPIALVALLLSLTMFQHEVEFAEYVGVTEPLSKTMFMVVPVLVLVVVTALRSWIANRARARRR